jgi:hypothetical protein
MNILENYFDSQKKPKHPHWKSLNIWHALQPSIQEKIQEEAKELSHDTEVVDLIQRDSIVFASLDQSLTQFVLQQLSSYWDNYCQTEQQLHETIVEEKKVASATTTSSTTSTICPFVFLRFAKDLSRFVKDPLEEIVNMMKGSEYGLDENILATSMIIMFLRHKNLQLPLFIPVLLRSQLSEENITYMKHTLYQALAYSQLNYVLSGRHLPIVIHGSLSDAKDFHHSISLFLLPVTLSFEEQDDDEKDFVNPERLQNDLTRWTLLVMDSTRNITHGIGKKILKIVLNKIILPAFQSYTSSIKQTLTDHREVISLVSCSESFQDKYGTCGHWSFAFVLNVLTHFPRYAVHYTDTEYIASWCSQLSQFVSSPEATENMLTLLADLAITFSKFLFVMLVEPILNLPQEERQQHIGQLISKQCTALEPSKSAKTNVDGSVVNQQVIGHFCDVVAGMIQKWPWIHKRKT